MYLCGISDGDQYCHFYQCVQTCTQGTGIKTNAFIYNIFPAFIYVPAFIYKGEACSGWVVVVSTPFYLPLSFGNLLAGFFASLSKVISLLDSLISSGVKETPYAGLHTHYTTPRDSNASAAYRKSRTCLKHVHIVFVRFRSTSPMSSEWWLRLPQSPTLGSCSVHALHQNNWALVSLSQLLFCGYWNKSK